MMNWLDKIVEKHGSTHLLVLQGDLNDDFGVPAKLGRYDEETCEHIGPIAPEKEGIVSEAFRARMLAWNWLAPMTFWSTGPTFFSPNSTSTTRIDHKMLAAQGRKHIMVLSSSV